MSSQTEEVEQRQSKRIKKSLVDHTYRDYSLVPISDLVANYSGIDEEIFPSKLHTILSRPEYENIIQWKPHGRAWAVTDRGAFTSVVLPEHFNHSNFASFNRSVNGWGFKRLVKEGRDHSAYYHELFLAGRPELTCAMSRLINPGKRLPNKADEPDFYDISRKYPLSGPPPPSTYIPASKPNEEVATASSSTKQIPSPIYAPSPTTKHHQWFHASQPAQHGATTYHHYGYRSYPPMPQSKPPSFYQQPTANIWMQQPYAQSSQNCSPLQCGTPGQFYHPPPSNGTPSRGGPDIHFHPNPAWRPENMHHPQAYLSSTSQQHYFSTPVQQPAAHHRDTPSLKRMLPILHTPQKYDHPSQVNQIERRDQAARQSDAPKQDQDGYNLSVSQQYYHPTLDIPHVNYHERSSPERMPQIPQSHQNSYSIQDCQIEQMQPAAQRDIPKQDHRAEIFPVIWGPEKKALQKFSKSNNRQYRNEEGEEWGAGEKLLQKGSEPDNDQCHNAEEEYNPLDIDNFYAPTVNASTKYEKLGDSSSEGSYEANNLHYTPADTLKKYK